MSLSKELILKEFHKVSRLAVADLVKKLGVTRQAVHKQIAQLVREGHVLAQGSSKKTTYYILNTAHVRRAARAKRKTFHLRTVRQGLEEDALLKKVESQAGLLERLSPQAKTNFAYAFTEMANNAIDHSQAKLVDTEVGVDETRYRFTIRDNGVGLFENIRAKKELLSEVDAIQDVLKGKQTTMPAQHSGEGVFFTSKLADRFVIESHRKRLVVDNALGDVFVEDIRFMKGTRVVFEQRVDSKKKLDELFHEYSSEEFKFNKSHVVVKLFTSGEMYVSRSQAKRLLHAMEEFEEIVLDFSGVPTIGQAFADEIFRVFQSAHPAIKIAYEHANENVEFMIRRAKTQLS